MIFKDENDVRRLLIQTDHSWQKYPVKSLRFVKPTLHADATLMDISDYQYAMDQGGIILQTPAYDYVIEKNARKDIFKAFGVYGKMLKKMSEKDTQMLLKKSAKLNADKYIYLHVFDDVVVSASKKLPEKSWDQMFDEVKKIATMSHAFFVSGFFKDGRLVLKYENGTKTLTAKMETTLKLNWKERENEISERVTGNGA